MTHDYAILWMTPSLFLENRRKSYGYRIHFFSMLEVLLSMTWLLKTVKFPLHLEVLLLTVPGKVVLWGLDEVIIKSCSYARVSGNSKNRDYKDPDWIKGILIWHELQIHIHLKAGICQIQADNQIYNLSVLLTSFILVNGIFFFFRQQLYILWSHTFTL